MPPILTFLSFEIFLISSILFLHGLKPILRIPVSTAMWTVAILPVSAAALSSSAAFSASKTVSEMSCSAAALNIEGCV